MTTTTNALIDLSSDTATRPTVAMREAMARAPVGDDQRGEDPTVNELCDHAADLLGKEAALFLPSATMANQIAIKAQTRAGDEIICHEHAHIRLYEGGGPAVLSGVMLWCVGGARGVFGGDQVRAAFREPDVPHYPRTRMVCIENTHNAGGGCVWTEDEVAEVARTSRELGLAVHLDGSRFLNAATALGVRPALLAAPFDTVTLCLSKGLGAPVGAILAGDAALISEARRWKHVFGGAMRQAGIVAAGGLYALRHHVERLREDHANAACLAEGLGEIPGVLLDPAPETNLVFFNVSGTGLSPDEAKARLLAHGVRASGAGDRLRFVTHLDVSRADIDTALAVCRRVLAA